jgi:hypothetical protein
MEQLAKSFRATPLYAPSFESTTWLRDATTFFQVRTTYVWVTWCPQRLPVQSPDRREINCHRELPFNSRAAKDIIFKMKVPVSRGSKHEKIGRASTSHGYLRSAACHTGQCGSANYRYRSRGFPRSTGILTAITGQEPEVLARCPPDLRHHGWSA